MIRARDLGRLVAAWPPRANDNRRRCDRPALPLARLVLAGEVRAAGGRAPDGDRPGGHRPAGGAAQGGGLGMGWLAPQIALWSAGFGAACRLPAFSSSLALCRAWSEVSLAGAVSCASLAASGIELVGVALAGALAAVTPAAAARRPGR